MSTNQEHPKRVKFGIRVFATQAAIDALKKESHDTNVPISRILGGMLEDRYTKENQ